MSPIGSVIPEKENKLFSDKWSFIVIEGGVIEIPVGLRT
jgi:hypothetical protein